VKTRKMLIAVLVLVFPFIVSIIACGSSGPPAIGDVVVARSVDADSKPVDTTSTFGPSEKIYISVQVKDLVVGSVVQIQYKLNGVLVEKSDITADQAGSGYYGFSLTPSDLGHASGTYNAEVYLDGMLAKTVTYSVEGGKAGIIDVVLSSGLDANNSPLLDKVTSYGVNDTFYFTVQVNNVAASSELKFVIEYAGNDTYKANSFEDTMIIKEAGPGQYTYSLDPPTDGSGHATGNYTIQVYLDGEPFGSPIPFSVQ